MNFEEMLNARPGAAIHREKTPLGEYYKKQNDGGKYQNVVQLSPRLVDSIAFCEALKADVAWSVRQSENSHMHGVLHGDSSGLYELELSHGSFQTLSALLSNNPAIVADSSFTDSVFNNLAATLEKMHGEGVFQLCLAPENILLRKGSDVPLLLMHGSFYKGVSDQGELYDGLQTFVAPEVLARQTFDERSDVYALGRLMEHLFSQGAMPFEFKRVVKKATAEEPDQRYKTVAEMKGDMQNKRNTRRTLLAFVAAVAIALLAVWVYVDWMPEANTVEFVEPAPKTATDDPFDTGFDPEMEMLMGDSLPMTDEDLKYQQKAEEIFRRRYAQEADRILSEIYDDKRMSATEKNYMAGSKAGAEELIRLQTEMGKQAGLSDEQAGRIAQEIVDKITKEKQEKLTRKGYLKGEREEEN